MTIERDELGFDAPIPLGHPARSSLPNGHSTGPAIGDLLEDFELPNSQGNNIQLHKDRGDAKAVVVFFRSVVW